MASGRRGERKASTKPQTAAKQRKSTQTGEICTVLAGLLLL
jgi:hypothetical protein